MDHNDAHFERCGLIYGECAATYRYYLDWRSKIFTRHAVAFGATLLVSQYIIDKEFPTHFISIPLFLFALLSFVFYRLDVRHDVLANAAAASAARIEETLIGVNSSEPKAGFYYFQINNSSGIFSHAKMFRWTYIASILLSLVGGFLALFFEWK